MTNLNDPKNIDKKKILTHLIENLQKELSHIEEAAKSARELATQDASKSEGKYDTRAIEASYLAGAQSKRVEEIKLDIQMLEEIELPKTPSASLQLGSLGLISCNGQKRLYFISSTSGGAMMQIEGNGILIISIFSPIGNAALGLGKNEIFEVETPKETREYKVIDVY